jgi:hypothetical protein
MLSDKDVVGLFKTILERSPESQARIERAIAKHSSRESLAAELRRSREFRDRKQPALISALKQTDGYQAVYCFPGLSASNARDCEDRCAAIENHLRERLRC